MTLAFAISPFVAFAADISVSDEAGLKAAVANGDNVILTSDVTLTSQLNINLPLTLDGGGFSIFAPFAKTDNSNNSAIGVINVSDTVTIKNLTIDSAGGTGSRHGVHAYRSNDVRLENVTINNSNAAAMIVNGSNVTADGLNTSGNVWGAVNVDPGDGVTEASTLTFNSGTLSEAAQIWSDGHYVTNGAMVTVEAPGFEEVYVAKADHYYTPINTAKATRVWTSDLTALSAGKASITKEENTLYYGSIQDALADAVVGDVIDLAPGTFVTTGEIQINKELTLRGAGADQTVLAPNFSFVSNAADNSVIEVLNTTGVVIENLAIDGTNGTNIHGINIFNAGVTINSVVASNNDKSGVTVNGSDVTVSDITTSGNAWGGINVDITSSATSAGATASILTVNSASSHSDVAGKPAIWMDDVTRPVSLNDTEGQYKHLQVGLIRSYSLKEAVDQEIDVSAGLTDGTGPLPELVISNDELVVEIPDGTVVDGGSGWDGKITPPTVVTAPTITVSGNTATAITAIEVGAGDTALTFDQPVKLTFAGQAGNLVGWSRNGVFTSIENECDSLTAPTLTDGADCSIADGSDLIVWTKHFTTFVTYTLTSTPAPSTGGGSAGGTNSARRAANLASLGLPSATAPAGVGQVLGAFTGPLDAATEAKIVEVKGQIVALINQLLSLLQAQLAAAVAAGQQ